MDQKQLFIAAAMLLKNGILSMPNKPCGMAVTKKAPFAKRAKNDFLGGAKKVCSSPRGLISDKTHIFSVFFKWHETNLSLFVVVAKDNQH
jgi:hypothetical protein